MLMEGPDSEKIFFKLKYSCFFEISLKIENQNVVQKTLE